MKIRQLATLVATNVFLGLALFWPGWVAPASADDAAEIRRISELLQAQRRAIEALQEQNRTLEKRLAELEAAQRARAHKPPDAAEIRDRKRLEERVQELEVAKTAQEDATRSIIRDAIATLGSNINESVALGGALEMLAGWTENFSAPSEGQLELSTAEFDFEIQVNDWTLGTIVIAHDVDRIVLDTASLIIGDPQRFPPFGTFGQIILPFGISTGSPVADVLTISDPLTIEAFEMKEVAFGFGLGFPTPAVTPAAPPVTPPPVRPLVLNPLIGSLMRGLGYAPPPTPPPAPTPITAPPTPPLFNVGLYSYHGDTFEGEEKTGGYKPFKHMSATLGFRTQGTCGRIYDHLRDSWLCPWSIDIDVDFNTSVFDSDFLQEEYNTFLGRIGFVPGMAVSVKTTFGPFSFVGEWNGAIGEATFMDDAERSVSIRPSAWQLSLGYQFDWNPWIEEVGAQGNYIAVSYSESRDLAGVMQLANGELSRIGTVPRRRLLVSVGEWVLDSLKFAIEYAHIVDYPTSEGGTGRSANGVFTTLTAVW